MKLPSNKPCPKCQELGKDNSGDNLFLTKDQSAYLCRQNNVYHAIYRELVSDSNTIDTNSSNITANRHSASVTVEEILHNYSAANLVDRAIREEVLTRFGVKVAVSTSNREEITDHYYPICKGGKLSGYKIRSLPKTFKIIGDAKGKIDLFGQHLVQSSKKIVITGGELDALAVYQMLKDYAPRYEPAVVSLPKGENVSAVGDNLNFFSRFQEVLVYTDMDEVGRKTAKDIAHLIGLDKVKIISTSEKDGSDMLVKGKNKEFIDSFFGAKPYAPEGVIAGTDLSLEQLRKPLQEGYAIPYPRLQDKIHGLRKGELVTLTAGSGVGKSTLARELAYHLMKHYNLTIGNIFLEEVKEHTAVSYIAIDNNVPLVKLRMQPDTISSEAYEQSYRELIANGRWYGLDHFGSLESDDLMDKMRYLAVVAKCDFIFLDHLSMVISGQDSNNERKDIDMLMTKLAALCNELGVGIISVVHLSRNRTKTAFNEGGQVSLSDLRGSAGLEQLSWAVLALERNQQHDTDANLTKIRVLKNRMFGFTGVTDTCEYSYETGRLLPVVVDDGEY